MNTKSIIVGLTALAGLAAISAPASAMPIGAMTSSQLASGQTSEVENVRLVCNAYGRCWRQPNYYYGRPAYFARPRYYGGYGYRRYRRW